MQKVLWLKIGLAVVGVAALAGLVGYFMIFHYQKTKICFQDFCWQAEVANNRFTIAKGLMFRQNLAENEAMLFILPYEGSHSFWMKNTLIPLDIVWLNKDKKVVDIAKDAQPCSSNECPSYRNQQPAQYVLEINAGQAEKISLETGSILLFELGL